MNAVELAVGAAITSPLWGMAGFHLTGEAWHWLCTPQQRWVEPQAELPPRPIPPARGLVLDGELVEVGR